MPPKANEETKSFRNDAGFTLLEILAVLVIMSILAVVAIPKYFDLQAQSQERAMKSALTEGVARVNGYFAQEILNGATPSSIVYDNTNLDTANIGSGEFTMGIVESGTGPSAIVTITVTAVTGEALDGAPPETIAVPRPGI